MKTFAPSEMEWASAERGTIIQGRLPVGKWISAERETIIQEKNDVAIAWTLSWILYKQQKIKNDFCYYVCQISISVKTS
jgi:hypothetical protein